MPKDNTLIAPATGATTGDFWVRSEERFQARISADALAGIEVVDVQVWMGTAFVSSGEELTTTEPSKIINGPGSYRLSKGVTASPCGLYLDL